jgi:hypothetical protein
MQAKRYKGAIERVRFERQLIGFARTLIIMRDWIFVLMSDVEHGQSLVNADDLPAFHLLRERSRDAARTGGYVQDQLAAFERKHLDQFLG